MSCPCCCPLRLEPVPLLRVRRAVRAMNESLRTGRRRSDSVVKEPPSATGTASSTSNVTPTANAAHARGQPPTEVQVHGGAPQRFDRAHREEMPETEVYTLGPVPAPRETLFLCFYGLVHWEAQERFEAGCSGAARYAVRNICSFCF